MLPPSDNTATSPPTTYKLAFESYAEFRRALVIRLGIVIPLLLAGFVYLDWHFVGREESPLFRLVFIVVLLGWLSYRQFRQQRNNWRSLEFDFRDGKLVRRLDKYPPFEFLPGEVSAIIESPKGITIKTNNRLRTLFISNRLSNYESFRIQLASWAPEAPVTKWTLSFWNYVRNICELLACAWVFGGPLYLMYTQRRAAILPLGIVLTFSMLAMLLYVRNSPHMPIRAQKGMWFLLLLPILAMVSRLAWAQ